MKYIYIILLFSACTNAANAQIFGKISDALDSALDDSFNKISDKIAERMLERFIEKTMNGEEASSDSLNQYAVDTTANESSATDLRSIFGTSSKKVEKVFKFDYDVTMAISSKENTNEIVYHMPAVGTYVAMKMSSVLAIVDFETEESYTIVNGSLMSFNMSKMFDKMSQESQYKEGEFTVVKTGRTDEIVSRLCEEYIITSADYTSEVWMTNDFINNDLRSASGIERILGIENPDNLAQYAMRVISTDKKGEKTTMEVTSINHRPIEIDLSQY